ncbi:ABC transporter permease [Salinibacterium sp. ZJ454]|uniref:ABC transporter permease n=1 Tax=Salinibacterium sp. ZJ454 TaxID=2708339 RepID=UPI0014235BE9|nr:ABC transporter permease [Salinibacterium sp. ZJ454]
MSWLTGFVGAVLEAWSELRIHRTRVLLSLIGVAVAVAALTSVVGVSSMARQAMQEGYERSGGRPATVVVMANQMQGQPNPDDFNAAMQTAIDRYEISFASRSVYSSVSTQFTEGTEPVQAQGVDPAYGQMFRMQLEHGRWFTEQDSARLAPAVIVNAAFHARLGSPDLASHPTVTLRGEQAATAVIIGVTPSQGQWDTAPSMFLLADQLPPFATDQGGFAPQTEWRLWVPPEIGEEMRVAVQRDVKAALGDGYDVQASRNDYLSWGGGDPLAPLTMAVGGIAVLILALGVLGLVNITMVTVRYRIREIGIRRSFGATSGRVFFTVMMESVVATAVAGVAGVMLAIAVVSNPWLQQLVAQGVQDLPPFPMEAAVIGMVTAVGAGALAGLLPALVAVRVKVIDAIRY